VAEGRARVGDANSIGSPAKALTAFGASELEFYLFNQKRTLRFTSGYRDCSHERLSHRLSPDAAHA